eukprot:scaffold2656_cov365-Pavlova_lutheri.AAC.3
MARRGRGRWRQRAFALVRAFVGVAAAAEMVGRNVRERCSLVVVPFRHTCYYIHTPLGNPPVAEPRIYPVHQPQSPY